MFNLNSFTCIATLNAEHAVQGLPVTSAAIEATITIKERAHYLEARSAWVSASLRAFGHVETAEAFEASGTEGIPDKSRNLEYKRGEASFAYICRQAVKETADSTAPWAIPADASRAARAPSVKALAVPSKGVSVEMDASATVVDRLQVALAARPELAALIQRCLDAPDLDAAIIAAMSAILDAGKNALAAKRAKAAKAQGDMKAKTSRAMAAVEGMDPDDFSANSSMDAGRHYTKKMT